MELRVSLLESVFHRLQELEGRMGIQFEPIAAPVEQQRDDDFERNASLGAVEADERKY